MKVLMFGWEFPPFNSGGLGVACQGLANALCAQETDLTFVLPKKLGVSSKRFRFRFADGDDADVIALNSLLVPYVTSGKYRSTVRGAEPGVYGSTLFEEVRRYANSARSIARSETFDIIHAHDWLSFGAGIAAREVSGKPLIAHVHATEVDRTAGNVNQYIYDQEKRGAEMADRVITVSEFTKNILVSKYGINPDKISVVHNGVDPRNYNTKVQGSGVLKLKKMGYKIVLFVGRITVMKGVDYLISAAKKVLEHNPKVIFLIVGSGDMEGQVMHQAASLGISNKVLFPGFLRGDELSQAYKSADLFVMPSVAEPFGLTSLESIVHGTPVLISKQSGAAEVLKNALKTDFWDVDDMADKMLSVVKYKSLHDELVENGKRDVAACNWPKAASECMQVYRSLI